MLHYKAETMRTLNDTLQDPLRATDEALAAVLLLIHIVAGYGLVEMG